MPADPTEIATNPIQLETLPDVFTGDGREVQSPGQLLEKLGVSGIGELVSTVRAVAGAVQTAQTGAIQDPAGSAVGFDGPPYESGAGGASGAIYRQFKDLKPIPRIRVRSAIFNSSTGPGRRVLHTYSPRLSGSPDSREDRRKVVEDLANSYANALEAFREGAADLGADGALLNLIPVSAGIFAGGFRVPAPYDHLHPSYTICALAFALNWWRGSTSELPSLALYYYGSEAVFDDATELIQGLSAA